MNSSQKDLPPGPRIPAVFQLAQWYLGLPELLESCHRRYGDTFTIRTPVFGTFVVLSELEDVRCVMRAVPEQFDNGGPYSIFSSTFGPSSTIAATGAEHRRSRRMLGRCLQGEMAVQGAMIQDAVRHYVHEGPSGEPILLRSLMEKVTLAVVAKATLGLSPGQEIATLLKKLRRIRNPMEYALARRFLPWLGNLPARRDVFHWIDQQVAARRQSQGTSDSPGDALSDLIDAVGPEGERKSDEAIRSDILLMLMAGHGTTATSLCWALLLILDHPEVLARIREELSSGAEITGASGFEYLDAAVMETLRLRPVAPLIFRRLASPMRIGDVVMPAGVTLSPCPLLLHRREDVYPEAHRFMPERFLDKQVDPNTWLTFGGGFRRCLGAKFAQFEMRVVLATLLSEFNVELNASTEDAVVEHPGRFIFSPSERLTLTCRRTKATTS